jgi:hypothetical protein
MTTRGAQIDWTAKGSFLSRRIHLWTLLALCTSAEAFVAATFEVKGANAQSEHPVTRVMHNNLVDVIVAAGEVRKVERTAAVRVDQLVQETLATRDLSKLFEWVGELLAKPILPRQGSDVQYVILEYPLISKYSSHFKVGDELVIGYKAIEGGSFSFEGAGIVNRDTK